MMYRYGGDGIGWMIAAMLLIVVLLVGLAAVVWLSMMRGRASTAAAPTVTASGPGSTARAHVILDERFARGEIDEVEYRARRAALDERTA